MTGASAEEATSTLEQAGFKVQTRDREDPGQVGLVVDRQDGTRRVYRVDPAGLAPLRSYLERFWQKAMVAFAQYAEDHHAENQAHKENDR